MNRLIPVLFFLLCQGVHGNTSTLKRGAHVFMNACSGCHTLKYMRDDRLAHDLGFTKADEPLHFMRNSMPKRDAIRWFGRVPPDLSLTASVRGTTWLTAYLTGFYPDANRPFGANNRWLPMTAMPNVFAPMADQVALGVMSQSTLDGDVRDVVSFLEYVSEPTRGVRYRQGVRMMIFLGAFGGLFLLFNKRPPFKRRH